MSYTLDKLVIDLSASDPENESLTFSVATGSDPVQQLASALDEEYGFQLIPGWEENNFWLNYRGVNEKYLAGFYVLPDGSLYQWGGSISGSTIIAKLDSRYWDDPTLLIGAESAEPSSNFDVPVSLVGNTLIIDPDVDFRGSFPVTVSVSDGTNTTSETFNVSVVDAAPVLNSTQNRIIDHTTDSFQVELSASDLEGDQVTFSAVVSVDPVLKLAWELDQRLGLELFQESQANNFWLNFRGSNEKYLVGYFILPDGSLYKWGGSIAASQLIAKLDNRFYLDPSLLANAKLPVGTQATLSLNGFMLTIDPADGYFGIFEVSTSATDGINTSTSTFEVTVLPDPRLEYVSFGVQDADKLFALRASTKIASSFGSENFTNLINETEDEAPATRDENDSFFDAQFILGFGTGLGEDDEADIKGVLAVGDSPIVRDPFTEDDGSIQLAGSTGLITGKSFVVNNAQIGDGLHGSTGTGTGDFDFYKIPNVLARQTITVDLDTPNSGLDTVAFIFASDGVEVAFNDNDDFSSDSFITFTASADDTYYVAVTGSPQTMILNPFDSSSGSGSGSEGAYNITIGLDSSDVDFYSFELEPGDIIGAAVTGGANLITLYDPNDTLFDPNGLELIGSSQDLSFLAPSSSPLSSLNGNAVLSAVAGIGGTYSVAVTSGTGAYDLSLRVFRPFLERQPAGAVQTIFLDFDGAVIDTSIFPGGIGTATLSPLSSFLPNWGLTAADENTVITAIVNAFEENISEDIRLFGLNGNFDFSGIDGDFDIEILNSRDDVDPFGQPNVSSVIIGGTFQEFG
ncbi:MAG: PPC domain-containing protein, partial [Planctomycetes bacterium]|nr:PPC domain-containing protein [Planctomycetota bacterium]